MGRKGSTDRKHVAGPHLTTTQSSSAEIVLSPILDPGSGRPMTRRALRGW